MPTIVHFDLPVDDLERAKKFYKKLFDWKFNQVPMAIAFYLIETKDLNGNQAVGGGTGKRRLPAQNIMNYIGVPSVEEYITKVKKLGGNIITPKTAAPGWGYLAICVDTENNLFGLWQEDKNAK
ncbi:MAG: VOC family protein [Candidatus Methanoperedens sp.]|nr:VOC family protein [Candidatus Methanoperedens sp.]MCZ7395305.1 VOC family protein [Candidatus Methanoperedens sp.]